MSDFGAVAEATSQWPMPVSKQAQGGTAARVLEVLRAIRANPASAGSADIAGLLAQVLREEAALGAEKAPLLRVPTAPGWPDRSMWGRHGVDVTLQVSGWLTLRAQPWCPKWVAGATTNSPLEPTLRGDVRRVDSRVKADPVVADLLAQTHYLSPGQRDAVRSSLLMRPGSSLLVVLPTGAGKSLVAHAQAILRGHSGGTTLLIVPTVALAIDQERRAIELFARRGGIGQVSTFAYHGGLSSEAKQALRRRISLGQQPLVITSPEAVVQGLRQSLFQCAQIGELHAIVIDEAHLVGQWGNEFRPDFQALAGVRRHLCRASPEGKAPVTVLLTATLTQDGWRTLRTLFGTPDLPLVAAVHLRPEPSYWLAGAPNEETRTRWVLEATRFAPRPFILYTTRRDDADRWLATLRAEGMVRVGRIHGDTTSQERATELKKWCDGAIDVMVATSAFGLGMDKADVRAVIHACVPETLDRFYQEVGRGGRDGRACVSLLIHEPGDMAVAEALNRERIVGLRKGLARWQAMFNSAARPTNDDRIVVSLDSRPAYVQGDTDANVAWNLRTLILMARSGLIELDAAEPPAVERGPGEGEAAFEERMRAAYKRFALSIAVRPCGRDHCDPETWRVYVDPSRQATLEADQRSLDDVKQMLSGNLPLADLLVRAYSVDAGTTQVRPTRVDGNCTASRAIGRFPGAYLPPEVALDVPLRDGIGPGLTALLLPDRVLLVAVPPLSPTSRRDWRESLIPAMRQLAAEGVREFRVPPGWGEVPGYGQLFKDAPDRLVFHTEAPPDGVGVTSELRVPRLTVCESPALVARLLDDAVCSTRPLELLFVAEDTRDPGRPDRALMAVRPHLTLSRLRKELD